MIYTIIKKNWFFEQGRRLSKVITVHVLLVLAVEGSGKSIMVAEIAKRTTRKGNRVLFLVHRRELIDQIKDTFQKMGVDNQLVNFGMVQTVVRHLETIKNHS